jgi:hypothetical protein
MSASTDSITEYDPSATPEQLVEDLQRVQRENPEKFISSNFYRLHGAYSRKTWDVVFGTFMEFRRQAGMELGRQKAQRAMRVEACRQVGILGQHIDCLLLNHASVINLLGMDAYERIFRALQAEQDHYFEQANPQE